MHKFIIFIIFCYCMAVHASCINAGTKRCRDREDCSREEEICSKNIYCTAAHTCNSVTELRATNYYIWASNALFETGLQDDVDVNTYEFMGSYATGRNMEFRVAKNNYAYGEAVLYESIVHTTGIPNVLFEALGHGSFGRSSFTCSTGSTCTIKCAFCSSTTFYIEEGANFSLECLLTRSCHSVNIYHLGDKLTLSGPGHRNVQISMEYPATRRLSREDRDTTKDTPERVPEMNLSPVVVQNSKQRKLDTEVCAEYRSCSGNTIAENFVFCEGASSCKNSEVVSSLINCPGYNSCYGATLKADTVSLTGYKAARNAYIEAKSVSAINVQSSKMVIRSKDELTAYLQGYQSSMDSLIICSPGDDCTVLIVGFEAAKSATLDCTASRGTCTSSCPIFECENHLTVLEPCAVHDESITDCNSNLYCVYHADTCKARHAVCGEFQTSDDCRSLSSYCTWNGKQGTCLLKKNKTPALYKKYDRYF